MCMCLKKRKAYTILVRVYNKLNISMLIHTHTNTHTHTHTHTVSFTSFQVGYVFFRDVANQLSLTLSTEYLISKPGEMAEQESSVYI